MDPISILLFVRKNWALIAGAVVVGGLAIALGVSRIQLASTRNAFDAYKVAAVAAAQAKQKEYDGVTREADVIFIKGAPQIITRTQTLTKWIINNVENVANCPGPDLIRVFNASITGDGLTKTPTP